MKMNIYERSMVGHASTTDQVIEQTINDKAIRHHSGLIWMSARIECGADIDGFEAQET